ncbi:xanthine dehydrogenase YagR molybdenum-binding subunit [Flavobacteriaceae bacterium MAR_2010_188]|nr:xanthine dehydrogenase YagR molybdenum-binding subunit [Flavobacteriaceae bacterium MAR_2010_188]
MSKINTSGVGEAINRVEGILKVTGRAKYTSEFAVENKAYAQAINSTIVKGRIKSVDTSEALEQEGVLEVITFKNAPKVKDYEEEMNSIGTTTIAPTLQSDEVHYYGEYVGLVVAETFEQAQYAARLVKFEYEEGEGDFIFENNREKAYKPNEQADYSRGDIEKGLSEADVSLDETYNTPIEHHHPMELHAVIGSYINDMVMVYSSQQMIQNCVTSIAKTFQIPQSDIRVVAPYVGGGFGSKLNTQRHVTLALMASKMIGRPVQLTVTRTQMFTNTNLRQRNEQKIKIGAKNNGELTALSHETLSFTGINEQFYEACGTVSKMFYKVPNNLVTHRLMPMNLQTPFAMRAPGEAPGSFALESAMDEMAWKLKMDPVDFRIKNDTQVDPSNGKQFSSRLMVECLRIGAEKFGWKDRKMEPRTNVEGNWLKGFGVSAASRNSPYLKSSAKVILELKDAEVFATVLMDATDIGTGSYTIVAQTAAEYLNIPVERVSVELGDSDFPVTPGSGGSWGAASYCNGARMACLNAIKELKEKSGKGDEEVAIAQLLKDNNINRYEAEGTAEPSEEFKNHSVYSFGANFSEVWVDKDTGMFRIKRMVNVCAAGKVLNPKTAFGQVIGGIAMGAGMAMAEKTEVEPNHGNFITRSFADYHVPVNLDMANVEVVFLPEEDKIANAMGVKGIGELGITSVAGSIANAIFNATGQRFRDLPITPDKFLSTPLEAGVKRG